MHIHCLNFLNPLQKLSSVLNKLDECWYKSKNESFQLHNFRIHIFHDSICWKTHFTANTHNQSFSLLLWQIYVSMGKLLWSRCTPPPVLITRFWWLQQAQSKAIWSVMKVFMQRLKIFCRVLDFRRHCELNTRHKVAAKPKFERLLKTMNKKLWFFSFEAHKAV